MRAKINESIGHELKTLIISIVKYEHSMYGTVFGKRLYINYSSKKKKTMKRSRSILQALIAGLGLLVFIACTNNNESTKSAATSDSSNVATRNDTTVSNTPAPDTAAKMSTEKPVPVTKETKPVPVTKETKKATSKSTTTRRKGKATVGSMGEMKSTSANAAMKPDKNGVYDMTEVRPAYPGGHDALSDYITTHIEYPQMAIDDNKEGTVNVQFIVDENGKVHDARVVGGKLGDGLDEEAERIISQMPKWTAGKVKGNTVKTRVTLPITYKIEEE